MRIAFIGAGSIFTPLALYTIANSEILSKAEIYLVDIDKERLEFIEAVGRKIGRVFKKELKIWTFQDIRELEDFGIDYAVISVEKERYKRWRLDFEVPHKYGIKQVLGENGGIGGLSHTLRVVPIVLDVAKKIEDINSDARVFIYSNPEPRVTYAVLNYTKLRNAYGLCTGYLERKETLAPLLRVKENQITFIAAGLNHFTWITELYIDGEESYEKLDSALERNPKFEPLSLLLYRAFGLFPSPSDNHIGEYLSFAWDLIPEEKKGLKWIERTKKEGEEVRKLLQLFLKGFVPKFAFNKFIKFPDIAMNIVEGLEGNKKLQEAINVPNKGYIDLPYGTVVEVPAEVSPKGIKPLKVKLTREVIPMLRTQAEIQKLSAEAAAEGNIEKVVQAVLLDPVVNNAESGLKAIAELIEINLDMLPQFSKEDAEEIRKMIKS
ncbi:family 4 glycosyl hydrolase [Thermococcus barophilus]|uniref:Alpha-galactosidase/6-phospho-beta-glucosidase n=1 Tax=Thermococcus barophilus (strain DSM 11836 / MP) TaxID=391623 RepID=F0LMG4_THEBM|nr:alpha-galactosidase/6-phospho-beta-glucosidase [Thermococcus barophilus]ADT83943.1 alpha-galactosidase/6-phospho-beta-glucosidase [Thermococcus barophilus MP]